MIFRWSIWGEHTSKNTELLRYSVLSFRKQFGDSHQYIVYTDDPGGISGRLDRYAEIRAFPGDNSHSFCVYCKATWMKWCPSARLDINQTEFLIDSDVFLLKYPVEIDSFLADTSMKFAVMDEFLGQPWQHGAMKIRDSSDTPYVNAGFFVQKKGCDISNDLKKEFDWWQDNIRESDQTHHDEQGALAIALTEYLKNGELFILPKDRYVLIGENENANIENLDDVTMFHAVYPEHPAFYRFKNYIDNILK